MQQQQREKTIQNLKDGKIDVLVATDVAARGLDVDRISHVLNYDIPYDTESYVHRIGRTGRAGRKGEAILFVTPRERGMLRAIERATRQPIEPMELPSVETVNEQRVSRFLGKISDALESSDLSLFRDMVERYEREKNVPAVEIAAALAKLVQGDNPLLLTPPPAPPKYAREERDGPREHRGQATRKFNERDNASNSGAHRQDYRQDAPRPDARRAEPRPPREYERAAPTPRHEERQYTPPSATRPANAAEAFFDDEAPAPRQERSHERSQERPQERAPRGESEDVLKANNPWATADFAKKGVALDATRVRVELERCATEAKKQLGPS